MEIVTTIVGTLNAIIATLSMEVAAFAEKEKAGRQRITVYLVILTIAAVASVVGVVINYNQGSDVKTVVKYIEECQQSDSECKKRNDAVIAGAVIAITGKMFDATSCVQSVPLTERTDELVKTCRDRYIK
jgi:hypothetical protein